MAIQQGKIIESLDALCKSLDKDHFIYKFLLAYGFPKATITRLKDGSRNVASNGDVALKKQVYFRAVGSDTNVYESAEALKSEPAIKANDIRFVVVTDFDSLVAFDLKADESLDTDIKLLGKQYAFFLPLAGYEKAIMYSEHPADIKASEKMGQLFDLIRERNHLTNPEDIHALNVFLTRLLFCFYAEDTGIFEQDQMTKAIEATTSITGEDLDQFFTDLFKALNLPDTSQEKQAMPAHLQDFPYVNGGLFKADEPVPEFGAKARRLLLECGSLSWAEINPDIFGSMFQAVIDQEQRGDLGQHYTSVSNIIKVIKPLFLDKLWEALESAKGKEKKLKELLIRLQNIRVFDPACGSGNFLIIAYKELRKLEMAVIDELNAVAAQSEIYYSGIKLSQFHGVEIDDFAHEIATLSLWLTEHQMNSQFKDKFGYAESSLPLRASGNFISGDALLIDWADVLGVTTETRGCELYICGNPPFSGRKNRSNESSQSMSVVFENFRIWKDLDLVAAWFWKAAQFINQFKFAEAAFVSTNSVVQGEQVAMLWPRIFQLGIEIPFCYQTFVWKNSARDNAAVHVVIIGLSADPSNERKIYQRLDGNLLVRTVQSISAYLVSGGKSVVKEASKPLADVAPMVDGNNYTKSLPLTLSRQEMEEILHETPAMKKWIRPMLGADEFLNGKERWCLWLVDATEADISQSSIVSKRIQKTKEERLLSKKKETREKASRIPHLFPEIRQPTEGTYILVPRVSSERRLYVPVDILSHEVICTNKNLMIPNSDQFIAGVLMSTMHLDWMRLVGGRMKSDYAYSAGLVYNTFPWPEVADARKSEIEELAESIILIREDYPDKTLADLYDPDKMPASLLNAHRTLDQAVEKLYRPKPFSDATERLEHLFGRYEQLISKDQKGA